MDLSGAKTNQEKGNIRIRNMLASIERTFLPIGATIGRYRIIEEIDRGGMAVVYKALQLDLNREVALKVMPANISINRGFVERFLTEAHAVAKLSHPNIVNIYEVATEKNTYYLAMEYIPGKNLYYYLHYYKPKLVDVLEIVVKLTDALSYAHKQKIIHRDLKLNNVIMKDRLTPVLIDFGLAKALEEDGSGGITRTGEIMGSPSYMAPERLLGGQVDHRSDICSLGIMLYEMLTFKNPYLDQRNLHQTTINVMEANPIPPRKLIPWLPVEIEAITLKAMAKDMDARYQSMDELRADIVRYQRGEPVIAQPPSTWSRIRHFVKRNWAPLVIASLITAFSALFAVSIYLQNQKARSHWQLAFVEKFGNRADSPEWVFSDPYSWDFKDGTLYYNSKKFSFARFQRTFSRDLLIECDISADSQDLYNAGIFLFGDHPDSAYCFHLNKSGEALHGITFPGKSFLFQDISPAKIDLGTTNHLVIERIRNCLTFSINGKVAARVWDYLPPLGKGHDRIGFFANGCAVRFDNLKIYRRAIPEVPSPTLIADRFWERGDFEVALDEYRGLLLDFPSGEIVKEILVKMADCMVRLGKYKDAYEVLRKSHSIREKEESFSARAYFLEGIIFSRLGYSEMADSVLNLLARRFPTHPVNASAMTSALLRTSDFLLSGKPAIAYREIKALMDQYSRYPDRWGKLYLSLLQYYIDKGELDTALVVAEEIISIHSRDPEILVAARNAMGRIYLRMGRKENARVLFDQFVAANINAAGVWESWMELAEIYEYDFMYRDALTVYQKVFKEGPRSTPVPWIAAVKIGEILLRDSTQSGDTYLKEAAHGPHPFPKPRLIARYYLGEISEEEFRVGWSELYPNDKMLLYHIARKEISQGEKRAAQNYLSNLKLSLSTESWEYLRVYKILNYLGRW
ncbi:MAG TPA: protein kinase [Chitinispirillaceae bacterium]|nr:protein kinase [Chitinispirillaceae bacterium]